MFAPIPGVTVIGFGHKARHGKDTAVQAIVRSVPGAMRFSFADDLYAVARVLYGMTVKDAPLLQRIGVEFREKYGADVWIKSVYAKIADAKPKLALVSDVRFPNELDFIKDLGGTAIKVSRYEEDGSPYVDPTRPANHISETALDNARWDVRLENRAFGLREFETKAMQWANYLLSAPNAA